ncbi:unnamed protein product, partial [Nesidiocoris tenuis]
MMCRYVICYLTNSAVWSRVNKIDRSQFIRRRQRDPIAFPRDASATPAFQFRITCG